MVTHRSLIRSFSLMLILCVLTFAAMPAQAMPSDSTAENITNGSGLAIDFDTYTTGNIHNQDGWSRSGNYDHAVVDNTYGYSTFGTKSLRISNAVTSGSFGDQTFSKSLSYEAGESSAQNGGLSNPPRQNSFEAQWDFASTLPVSYQPNLSVAASPDRGDGARMSWVQMKDAAGGLEVNFYDYQRDTQDKFILTNVASGLDRTKPHTIKIAMLFVDGAANDVVKVYVDGVLRHIGTSWEDYFRDEEGNPTRTVDSILFRTSGTAEPATLGKGFLIDNLKLNSADVTQCTTDCYVDAVNGNDAQGGTSLADAKKTIQAALNQVSANGTVHVAAGTYTESPVINKPLTLVSLAGRATTIIQLKAGTTYVGALSVNASNVTIDGFTIKGYDAVGNNLASSNILLGPALDNLTVKNNRILVGAINENTNFDDGIGVLTTYDTNGIVDAITVTNNLFEPVTSAGARAFYINLGTDKFTFNNNTISGMFYYTAGTEAKNGLVDSNVISHTGLITESAGFSTWGSADATIWGHTVFSNNTISGVRNGISIFQAQQTTVTNNFFIGNNVGVSISQPVSATYSTVRINENSFVGNVTAAISNTSSLGTVNAERNWWNHKRGPTHASNPNGMGDKVSNNVDFMPWLCRGDDTSSAPGFQPNLQLSPCQQLIYVPLILKSN